MRVSPCRDGWLRICRPVMSRIWMVVCGSRALVASSEYVGCGLGYAYRVVAFVASEVDFAVAATYFLVHVAVADTFQYAFTGIDADGTFCQLPVVVGAVGGE